MRRCSIRKELLCDLKMTDLFSNCFFLGGTYSLIYFNFLEGCAHAVLPEGLMSKQLKSVVGRDAASALNLLNMKDNMTMKFLPPVIQEFRLVCVQNKFA